MKKNDHCIRACGKPENTPAYTQWEDQKDGKEGKEEKKILKKRKAESLPSLIKFDEIC